MPLPQVKQWSARRTALNASVKCLDGGPTLTVCLSVECDARLVVENNRISIGHRAGHVASRHDYCTPSSVMSRALVLHRRAADFCEEGLFLALSGHQFRHGTCLPLGVKQTSADARFNVC